MAIPAEEVTCGARERLLAHAFGCVPAHLHKGFRFRVGVAREVKSFEAGALPVESRAIDVRLLEGAVAHLLLRPPRLQHEGLREGDHAAH
eukprot:CAMPEP_0206041272 /NCGR_PEP_ID=MMETSP1466-20131121/5873_1 /ASSEMBLY_ACC=CAM_ASM_001126 /TAXON_ID=44452 /ORGANISM="Pavlova gyrans, Strain CCMP608" /LENGTH=89 /DNA_ID=CAMNT_0053415965 /DNA_START=331 /DNA_END=600 /DNA_ORIENTATION=-